MFRKYICPHCYEKFKPNQVIYKCTSVNCGKEFGVEKTPWFKRIYIEAIDIDNMTYCYEGNHENLCKALCPKCKNEFPYELMHKKNNTISIIGGSSTGKTIYLSVLMHELRNKLMQNRSYSCRNITGNDVLKPVRDSIYNDKMLPELTLGKASNSNAGKPTTYLFQDGKDASSSLIFSLYDSAGEDMQDKDAQRSYYNYISNSNGIIFFVDLFSENNEVKTVNSLDNLIAYLRESKGIKGNKQINVPIMMVFTKSDIIQDKLSAYSSIFETYEPWASMDVIDSISTEFENYLNSSNEEIEYVQSVINDVRINFKHYRLIPISTLGFNPGKNVDIKGKEIKPSFLEYPFIYFINKFLGKIDG